jgi:hypothetical protein
LNDRPVSTDLICQHEVDRGRARKRTGIHKCCKNSHRYEARDIEAFRRKKRGE